MQLSNTVIATGIAFNVPSARPLAGTANCHLQYGSVDEKEVALQSIDERQQFKMGQQSGNLRKERQQTDLSQTSNGIWNGLFQLVRAIELLSYIASKEEIGDAKVVHRK